VCRSVILSQSSDLSDQHAVAFIAEEEERKANQIPALDDSTDDDSDGIFTEHPAINGAPLGAHKDRESFISPPSIQLRDTDKIRRDVFEVEKKPPEDDRPTLDAVVTGTGKREDPLSWPLQSPEGTNEFLIDGLAGICFPVLLPYGCGDYTHLGRYVTVTEDEAINFYEKYADIDANGKPYYRFASHRIWSFWVMNRRDRHYLLRQSNYYMSTHKFVADMDYEELKANIEQGQSYVKQGISLFTAKLAGTSAFWWQQTENLKSIVSELGCPTIFYTCSMADNFWRHLYRLLPFGSRDPEKLDFNERVPILDENLHIAAWYVFRETFFKINNPFFVFILSTTMHQNFKLLQLEH